MKEVIARNNEVKSLFGKLSVTDSNVYYDSQNRENSITNLS